MRFGDTSREGSSRARPATPSEPVGAPLAAGGASTSPAGAPCRICAARGEPHVRPGDPGAAGVSGAV